MKTKKTLLTGCLATSLAIGAAGLSFAEPAAPSLSLTTSGINVSLSWTTVADATDYILFYAPYPEAYPINSINMGSATSFSAELYSGAAFYVAIKAYNATGGSDYSNISFFTLENECTDIAGNWYVRQYYYGGNCGVPNWSENFYITVSQNGCEFTSIDSSGDWAHGSISGNSVTFTSEWYEAGYSVYENGSIQVNGNIASGSSNVDVPEAGCSGSSTLTLSR